MYSMQLCFIYFNKFMLLPYMCALPSLLIYAFCKREVAARRLPESPLQPRWPFSVIAD